MLKVDRLMAEVRAARFAAPIPLLPRPCKGAQWDNWEVKEAVWLRAQGYTAKQIAFRLRRSLAAVEKQFQRIRKGKRKVT